MKKHSSILTDEQTAELSKIEALEQCACTLPNQHVFDGGHIDEIKIDRVARHSIAISLKRIADAMEKSEPARHWHIPPGSTFTQVGDVVGCEPLDLKHPAFGHPTSVRTSDDWEPVTINKETR